MLEAMSQDGKKLPVHFILSGIKIPLRSRERYFGLINFEWDYCL